MQGQNLDRRIYNVSFLHVLLELDTGQSELVHALPNGVLNKGSSSILLQLHLLSDPIVILCQKITRYESNKF